MSSTGSSTRVDFGAVIAGGFAVLAVTAAGNAAAMVVLRARGDAPGYGTLPLAAAAAVYAAAAAWCAVRVRAGWARSLRGPAAAWVASGLGVWLTVALTYRPGPMFGAVSAAALASWGTAGVWARRRLRGRGMGARQHPAAPSAGPNAAPNAAPNAVRDGEPNAATAGVPRRTGVRAGVHA